MRRQETAEGRSVRLLRVGEQVRHALSEVLMRGDVHDEVLASHTVSITEVRMSPDLRHATVFVKPLLGADEGEEAAAPPQLVVDPLRQVRDRRARDPGEHHAVRLVERLERVAQRTRREQRLGDREGVGSEGDPDGLVLGGAKLDLGGRGARAGGENDGEGDARDREEPELWVHAHNSMRLGARRSGGDRSPFRAARQDVCAVR